VLAVDVIGVVMRERLRVHAMYLTVELVSPTGIAKSQIQAVHVPPVSQEMVVLMRIPYLEIRYQVII